MTLKQLISGGFFCEELPPPFGSSQLAAKIDIILPKVSSMSSVSGGFSSVNYLAPNKGIHRRHFSLPHPLPHIKLSDVIVSKWSEIELQYAKSNYSLSKPEIDTTGARAIVYLDKYEKFREACIIASSTKRYQLHLDIAKYFYSIYTHSIPWAIHTKPVAKANQKDKRYWGNLIDNYLMMCQNFQTKGIPVGTDTSRIIAEILGCTIDAEFELALKSFGINLRGYRFVDDCRYFFDSLRDSELALDQYHKILTSYGLGLNEEKTIIESSPCAYDNSWKLPLNSAPLERKFDRNQRSDLKNYFNLLIAVSKDNPKEPVFKYGIKRVRKIEVHKNNIELFESLLFCVSLHDPSILPDILYFLEKYKSGISKPNLTNFIVVLIEQNVHKGNHYEVAWGLWIALYFEITLPAMVGQMVIDSRDVVSSVIAFDLIERGRFDDTINTADLILDLDNESLNNELWLLAYEVEFHKWLPLKNINSSPLFKILKKENVSFYQSKTTVSTPSTTAKRVGRKLPKKLVQHLVTELGY
jgi:hypothetical protein